MNVSLRLWVLGFLLLLVGMALGAGGQAWWDRREPAPTPAPAIMTVPAPSTSAADTTDWALQARTDAAQGRFREALPAFIAAEAQKPGDAQLFADHAEALAYLHGGSPDAQAEGLIAKALTLDPANVKALVLAGSWALQKKDFLVAIDLLSRAAGALPPDQIQIKQLIDSRLAEARLGQGKH